MLDDRVDNATTSDRSDRALTRPSRGLLVALALTVSLVACSTSTAPAAPKASGAAGPQVHVDAASILDAMLAASDEHAAAAAVAALPAPLSTSDRSVPNHHAPRVTDRVSSLDYGGVMVEVYRPGAGATPLLTGLELTTPGVELGGLRVGMTVSEVHQRLGRPSAVSDDLLVYRLSPPAAAPHELSVTVAGDTVTALRWAAYLD